MTETKFTPGPWSLDNVDVRDEAQAVVSDATGCIVAEGEVMDSKAEDLLSSIQGLCRTIRDEHGVYVSYTEHLHNGATEVVASVLTGHDGDKYTFHRLGSDMLGSFEAVRDGLAEHLVKMREAT